MGLTTLLGISCRATNVKSLDLSDITDPMLLALSLSLTSGTGSGKADDLFHDIRTLANAGSETLNLANGSLTDSFGDTIDIVRLKVLIITNPSLDATLLIGDSQAGSQLPLFAVPSSDSIVLPFGGQFVYAGGDVGLDITGVGNLRIRHGGEGSATVEYKIVAIGASA